MSLVLKVDFCMVHLSKKKYKNISIEKQFCPPILLIFVALA